MMSHEYDRSTLLMGATLLAGLLGTLSAMTRSNPPVQGWTDQAKNVANNVMQTGEAVNKNMLLGGVAGGIIGATAALLFAPKPGADLIKDLIHPFSHKVHRHPSHKKTVSRKSTSRRKTASHSTKETSHHTKAAKKEKSKSRTTTGKKHTHAHGHITSDSE